MPLGAAGVVDALATLWAAQLGADTYDPVVTAGTPTTTDIPSEACWVGSDSDTDDAGYTPGVVTTWAVDDLAYQTITHEVTCVASAFDSNPDALVATAARAESRLYALVSALAQDPTLAGRVTSAHVHGQQATHLFADGFTAAQFVVTVQEAVA